MAKIKRKRASPEVFSCKFGGMASRTARIGVGAEDVCNFRADQNGTLRTRSGYRLYRSFSHGTAVRGVWEGMIGEEHYSFVSLGRIVYRLSADGVTETAVGSVGTSQGEVQFVLFDGALYLLDGNEMRVFNVRTNRFTKLEAYVPLYGRNWSPSSFGDVCEDINLLTPRLRVHYFNSSNARSILLPFYADSIDAMWADGRLITNYSFTAGENVVYLTADAVPVSIEIGFTVSLGESLRQKLMATPHAFVHFNNAPERLLLYGNDHRVFYSAGVTDTDLAAAHVLYPDATSLYCRSDDVLFLGDTLHPVTAVTPLYDTLLAFTAERVYSVRFDKEGETHVIPTLEGIGCHSPHGALTRKNEVLTVSEGGVYRLSAPITHPDALSAVRISETIDGKLSREALWRSHLFWYAAENEIWLRDPENTNGEVWVWNGEQESWFRFDHINAAFFYRMRGAVGFADGGDLMELDSEAHTDNGAPIQSLYQSGYLDLGGHERLKRTFRGMLCANLNGGDGSLVFENERARTTYPLSCRVLATCPESYDFRGVMQRFRFLRFTVALNTQSPAEVYRCDIYAMP